MGKSMNILTDLLETFLEELDKKVASYSAT
jgi:hypothetical protein